MESVMTRLLLAMIFLCLSVDCYAQTADQCAAVVDTLKKDASASTKRILVDLLRKTYQSDGYQGSTDDLLKECVNRANPQQANNVEAENQRRAFFACLAVPGPTGTNAFERYGKCQLDPYWSVRPQPQAPPSYTCTRDVIGTVNCAPQ